MQIISDLSSGKSMTLFCLERWNAIAKLISLQEIWAFHPFNYLDGLDGKNNS